MYMMVTKVLDGSIMGPYPVGSTALGTSHNMLAADLEQNTLYEVRFTAVTPDGWVALEGPVTLRTSR